MNYFLIGKDFIFANLARDCMKEVLPHLHSWSFDSRAYVASSFLTFM